MSSGVYQIVNTESGKRYIGSSVDIKKRFRAHRCKLRAGEHHNSHLNNSWDKNSEEAFEFSVIEECSEELLHIKEQMYLEVYLRSDNWDKLYNFDKGAGFLSEKLRVNSEGMREKVSKSMSGENHPLYGKEHSEEAKRRMSVAHKGKTLSEEHREKLSKARSGTKNPMYGVDSPLKGETLSEKHKRKISEANKGSGCHTSKVSEEDVIDIREAHKSGTTQYDLEEKYPISRSTIGSIIRGDTWQHVGGPIKGEDY